MFHSRAQQVLNVTYVTPDALQPSTTAARGRFASALRSRSWMVGMFLLVFSRSCSSESMRRNETHLCHLTAIWLPSDMSDISGIHMIYHMIHLIYLWYIDIKIIWYVNGPYKGSRGVPPLDLTQRPGPQPQISWVIPGTRRLEPLTGRGYTMSHQISCYLLLVVNYYMIMVNYCYMLYGYIWLIFLTVRQIWLTPKRVDFPAGIAARWESLVLFPAGIATSGNADLWNLMKWWWSDDEGHQELGVNSLWITMDK